MSSVTRQLFVVALLLAAVLGVFIAAESGQRRLEEASRQVQLAAERNRALGDVWQLLRQAESSQRGYILVDDANYLMPFQEAAGNLPQALARLGQAFATAPDPVRTDVAEVQKLSNTKFAEMRASLELFRTRGRTAAIDLMRTDIGANTMVQIDDRVRSIQKAETNNILQASRSWQISRWLSLTTTTAALLASLGLMLLLSRLVVRHMRHKERESAEQAELRAELEQLVERRTAELSELSTHLQSVAEQEKSALSRELHDELGGLLVAARMDVSWIEERIGSEDAEVLEHFKRLHEALQSGVEVKRRVVENLRPSLLDNLGLFPALHWQVEDSCTRAGLSHREHYPQEDELLLTPEASITVFRIVQEAVTNIIKHAQATTVRVSVYLQSPWLIVRVSDDGIGLPHERLRALRSHGLAAMRHRAVGLGGQWQVRHPPDGGTEVEVRLPLERVVGETVMPAEVEEMPATREELPATREELPAPGKAQA
ncbi:MAG TPA: CHASE3 domain-containing protein [Steroidobacteraceae bacterium]|nr:CHASE3 domain-containing protein [Steroidobacteraceae bacterium]